MGYHILIVERDPILRYLVNDILREERRDDMVTLAGSASDALEAVNRKPADVLITNWQIPDMDGLTLIKAVQECCPETHAILMSSADRGEVQERSRNRPASFAFFPKPFSVEAFLSHVNQVLTRKSPRPLSVAYRS